MPNVTPYKYEPQLDLEVDLKKPRTRLPITPSAAPRKKAAKSLMAPMSMDEFAFLDDQFVVGIDRPSATLAAAPLSVFEVPDDIFVNGDATDTKL
jgi:hypothetical protein